MSYAVNNILFPHCLYGQSNQHLVVLLPEADHLLGAQLFELALQLGKGQLDRVPLWAVAHVIAPSEAQLAHGLLRLVRGVDVQLVHEEADLVVGILLS